MERLADVAASVRFPQVGHEPPRRDGRVHLEDRREERVGNRHARAPALRRVLERQFRERRHRSASKNLEVVLLVRLREVVVRPVLPVGLSRLPAGNLFGVGFGSPLICRSSSIRTARTCLHGFPRKLEVLARARRSGRARVDLVAHAAGLAVDVPSAGREGDPHVARDFAAPSLPDCPSSHLLRVADFQVSIVAVS